MKLKRMISINLRFKEKMRKKIISILLICMILLSGTTFAEELTEEDEDSWRNAPARLVYWFFSKLDPTSNFFSSKLLYLIKINPDPDSVAPMVESYIQLIFPLFMLILVVTGAYLIFMSGSPAGRSHAKSMFWKTLLSMVLVSYSLEIIKIMMAISTAITTKILAGVTEGALSFGASDILEFYILLGLTYGFFIIFALVSVGMRYILTLMLIALFPITIFLYFFEIPLIGFLSKEMGVKLWNLTIKAIFAQVAQAIAFAVMIIGLSSSGSSDILAKIMISSAGMFLVAIAPLAVTGTLKILGAVVMGAGMIASFGNYKRGYALTATGALLMGQGPASLMAAGGISSLGYAKSRSDEAARGTKKSALGMGGSRNLKQERYLEGSQTEKNIEDAKTKYKPWGPEN